MMLVNHKLRAAFGAMVLALLFACGGGSNSSNGNADGGGSNTTPECQLPACYYDFVNSVQVKLPRFGGRPSRRLSSARIEPNGKAQEVHRGVQARSRSSG